MPDPIVSRPGEGEMHERDDGYRLIRVDLDDIAAIEIDFDETLVVPPHTHPDHVDAFYVLAGEAEFVVGAEVVRAGPGTWVAAPVGSRHGFRNAGAGELRLLNVHGPNTGFVERLRAPQG